MKHNNTEHCQNTFIEFYTIFKCFQIHLTKKKIKQTLSTYYTNFRNLFYNYT